MIRLQFDNHESSHLIYVKLSLSFMKRFFLTFFIFFSIVYTYANTIVIQGEIIDKKSGIPLNGVNVFNSNNKAQKTISGLDGSFTLKVESLPI